MKVIFTFLFLFFSINLLYAGLSCKKVVIVSKEEVTTKIQEVKDKMAGIENYTVQEGDTLKSISLYYYGLSDLWDNIYQLNINIITDPDLIFPGQVIRVRTVQK